MKYLSGFAWFSFGFMASFWWHGAVLAMGLTVDPALNSCTTQALATPNSPPPQASKRLEQSQVAAGSRNIAWAWLGSPTRRYPHPALGSTAHAGSLHVLARQTSGALQQLTLNLPLNRVFEDRVPRLIDLDGDGLDEILLIESELLQGSSLVVFGVFPQVGVGGRPAALIERARSPATGTTFRWLNPIGVADFDGDGKLDIASVTTPHVGGVLTLYHYRAAPAHAAQLVPFATMMDVSNHKMGALEQELAAIVDLPGHRPTIIVPDMTLAALHAFRWEAPGRWKDLAEVKPLPSRIERIERLAGQSGAACVKLVDNSWWVARLTH